MVEVTPSAAPHQTFCPVLCRRSGSVAGAVCLSACTLVLVSASSAGALASAGSGHADPVASVVLALAIILVAAIAGKQLCSLGVIGKGIDRLSVGIGMIPRGEAGLIFANLGLALSVQGERIIAPATFSAIVVMVIITTMATPPALKWSLDRSSRQTSRPEAARPGQQQPEGN